MKMKRLYIFLKLITLVEVHQTIETIGATKMNCLRSKFSTLFRINVKILAKYKCK